jgi:hypothetical protein
MNPTIWGMIWGIRGMPHMHLRYIVIHGAQSVSTSKSLMLHYIHQLLGSKTGFQHKKWDGKLEGFELS